MRGGFVGWLPEDMAIEAVGANTLLEAQQRWNRDGPRGLGGGGVARAEIPTRSSNVTGRDRSRVIDKPHPDCGWVFAGEGIATQKVDGTCCLVRGGKLFKRRELKQGAIVPCGF